MPLLSVDTLAQAIRARRIERGLRQEEVALVAGTGLRFIHDLERGKPTVQVGKLLQVLAALGLGLELCDRTGRALPPPPDDTTKRRRVRAPNPRRPESPRGEGT